MCRRRKLEAELSACLIFLLSLPSPKKALKHSNKRSESQREMQKKNPLPKKYFRLLLLFREHRMNIPSWMVQSEVGVRRKERSMRRTFATCFYGHRKWSSRETTEKLDIGTEKLIIEIHF